MRRFVTPSDSIVFNPISVNCRQTFYVRADLLCFANVSTQTERRTVRKKSIDVTFRSAIALIFFGNYFVSVRYLLHV